MTVKYNDQATHLSIAITNYNMMENLQIYKLLTSIVQRMMMKRNDFMLKNGNVSYCATI